jgi:RNA polymerase sigma-70 factor (ECF subfamily)
MGRLDRPTLLAWFHAHGRALVLYARQVLAAEDRVAAEDVVQDLFARLLARTADPGGLADPPNPAAWLHQCVRNACLDERRSRVRRSHRERSVAADRPDWFESRPEDLIDARLAEDVLATLPDALRQVVTLRVWSGLTLAEVAEVTGSPVSTVYDQYRKALSTVRQAIERRSDHVRAVPR